MFASFCLLFAALFSESKTLALQICLDRAGYSCNTIDGVAGRKTERALACWRADHLPNSKQGHSPTLEQAFDLYFGTDADLFQIVEVTQADLNALVKIPESPAARAALSQMGYESIKEMFAERGHLSTRALARMNPGVDWEHVRPGLKLVIPKFPSIDEELAFGDKGRRHKTPRPEAAAVRVSLSKFEVAAYDKNGRRLAVFPCSIAANKAKIPAQGELKITSYVARPNYTYTPDVTPRGQKVQRYIWPAGPNCPVGVAWMGLNLPGYGIHGTPVPESIGFTGSHGCFRLANWNAARLYAMCRSGTKVIIEP